MKSWVCNVFGMAMGVACLALLLNRSSAADDEPAPQEQKQVIVVQTEDGQTTEEQKQVIVFKADVVKGDEEKLDLSKALKIALHGKLEGLPEEIQKKIQLRLQAVKQAHPGKQDVQVKVIAVGSDSEATEEVQSASEEATTTTVVAQEAPGGEEKHVAIAVAVDGEAEGGDGELKTITVTMKDGQILVDGKPAHGIPLQGIKEGEIQIQVQQETESGEFTFEAKPDGDAGKKVMRRKRMILQKDGATKSFEFEMATPPTGVAVGKAFVVYGDKEGAKTITTNGEIQYEMVIVGDDAKESKGAHKIHMRALKGIPAPAHAQSDVLTVVPGVPLPHAIHFTPGQPPQVKDDVAKRLKNIESELKQIRKLLEEIQKDDGQE